jgi:hypothetical protein
MGKIVGYRGANGNDGNLRFYTSNTPTLALTITSTGAATFSSSVTGAEFGASGGIYVAKNGSNTQGSGPYFLLSNAASSQLWYQQLNASNGLDYWYNGSVKMTITSGGNVGIGSADSIVKLNIVGATANSAAYGLYITNSTPTQLFSVRNDGYFQASGIYNFSSSGGTAVYVSSDGGVYRFTSSERYKREITDYTKGLSKVLEIKPKWFKSINPKEGEKIFAGLIAEQIDEIGLNEFVEYNDEGQPDAVHYSAMTALLVKAIQESHQIQLEQQSTITSLQDRLSKGGL